MVRLHYAHGIKAAHAYQEEEEEEEEGKGVCAADDDHRKTLEQGHVL